MSENRYTGIPWVINVVAASRANLETQRDGGERRGVVRTVGDSEEANECLATSLVEYSSQITENLNILPLHRILTLEEPWESPHFICIPVSQKWGESWERPDNVSHVQQTLSSWARPTSESFDSWSTSVVLGQERFCPHGDCETSEDTFDGHWG